MSIVATIVSANVFTGEARTYKKLPQRFLSIIQKLIYYGDVINATVPETGMTHFWLFTRPVPSFDLESVLGLLLSKGLRVDEGPRIDDDTSEYRPFLS
jgi:hypothetical protein